MAKLETIAAIPTGAVLMYALDPAQGRRRRARMRDASRHWIRIGTRTFVRRELERDHAVGAANKTPGPSGHARG